MEEHESSSSTTPEDNDPGSHWMEDFGNPIEAVRKLALAGLGVVAVATEATDEVFSTLVKKGEETREEAMREIREARNRNAERRGDSEAFVRARVDSVLNKVNVASKGDIEALNAKLNIITRKLDEVQFGQSHSGAGSTPPTPEPTAEPEAL